MRPDIFAEILFILAILFSFVSLTVYGLIIKRLLILIKGRAIWVLPIIASFVLILLAIVHIYRVLFYFPRLGTAGPGDLFDLIVGSLNLARIESFLLLIAGIFPLIGALLYYRLSSK